MTSSGPDPRSQPDEAPRRLAEADRELETLRESLRAAQARERALVDQLQHRVRNMLAVIRSVFRRTLETGASTDEFVSHFRGRLDAIALYQADSRELRASGVELEDIVRDQLLAVGCVDEARITVAGPNVILCGKAIELMTLAVHELTTNSIKFGALAGGGRLLVEWSLAGESDDARVEFRWRETGVAPVTAAPRARGFGREFIEDALPYELGAATMLELEPGGLTCSITFAVPGAAPLPGEQG